MCPFVHSPAFIFFIKHHNYSNLKIIYGLTGEITPSDSKRYIFRIVRQSICIKEYEQILVNPLSQLS